jgi:uncharacterized membrane protein
LIHANLQIFLVAEFFPLLLFILLIFFPVLAFELWFKFRASCLQGITYKA